MLTNGYKVVRRQACGKLVSAVFNIFQVEYEPGRPARPPRKWHLGQKTAGRGAGPLAVFMRLDSAMAFTRHMTERGHHRCDSLEIWNCNFLRSEDECLWCYADEGYRETAVGSLPFGTVLADEVIIISKVDYK
jgi:hypothetical protein